MCYPGFRFKIMPLDSVKTWENASYEKGEAQSFLNEFFGVFGIDRLRVANLSIHLINQMVQEDLWTFFGKEESL